MLTVKEKKNKGNFIHKKKTEIPSPHLPSTDNDPHIDAQSQMIASKEREGQLKSLIGGFCKNQEAMFKTWSASCHQKLLQNQVSMLHAEKVMILVIIWHKSLLQRRVRVRCAKTPCVP